MGRLAGARTSARSRPSAAASLTLAFLPRRAAHLQEKTLKVCANHVVDPTVALVLPPWSYGFVVLGGVTAPACVGE